MILQLNIWIAVVIGSEQMVVEVGINEVVRGNRLETTLERQQENRGDPGGWFWDDGVLTEPAGWQYDASFSSGGFPDGDENVFCRWPPLMPANDAYVKLGVYNLGLGDTTNLYPSILVDHKPGQFPQGSAQDPSSIPFNTDESYWLRPYVITRNKGFLGSSR